MRTTIALYRDDDGNYDERLGHIDISHPEPLSQEAVNALRALGRVVAARMKEDDASS
jgi:hypothetical protein